MNLEKNFVFDRNIILCVSVAQVLGLGALIVAAKEKLQHLYIIRHNNSVNLDVSGFDIWKFISQKQNTIHQLACEIPQNYMAYQMLSIQGVL